VILEAADMASQHTQDANIVPTTFILANDFFLLLPLGTKGIRLRIYHDVCAADWKADC
jgi:hypothetical protein